ncbi:MAG: hypothetical protein ACRDRL_08115, partial [Sciscionella sp.]
ASTARDGAHRPPDLESEGSPTLTCASLADHALASPRCGPGGPRPPDLLRWRRGGAGRAPSGGGAFPASVVHGYGTTVIPDAPTGVVALGYTDQDAILALGVVPVAIREFTAALGHVVVGAGPPAGAAAAGAAGRECRPGGCDHGGCGGAESVRGTSGPDIRRPAVRGAVVQQRPEPPELLDTLPAQIASRLASTR